MSSTGTSPKKLYLMHVSVHGLIRGSGIELGRDSDTGGQTKYVVELSRALAEHPEVEKVDLLTRKVEGKNVDSCYSELVEDLGNSARIVRLPCGPKRYVRKERLWPHLDTFVDEAIRHIQLQDRIPDAIHGHYADAGYVAAQLARLFAIPCIFTGHSLGRVKRKILLEKGASAETLEQKFHFTQRIEAEEVALDTASFVVASTRQETEEQYALYDNYHPRRMQVIPPGVDIERYATPDGNEWSTPIAAEVSRFLATPNKPLVLAIARPDERKNFPALVNAFGAHPQLREIANLVLIAGNREDMQSLNPHARRVLRQILALIDSYDLYGSVAYPKQHTSEDVLALYRLASLSKGVFVNPAFTEPFGLTLIEAAASGLPIIATDDGGPRDIIASCQNGLLIDPHNPKEIGDAIYAALTDAQRWQSWSSSGVEEARNTYSWSGHVASYIDTLTTVVGKFRGTVEAAREVPSMRFPRVDRLVLTNVDETLTSDSEAAREMIDSISAADCAVGLGYTTGRTIESLKLVLDKFQLPQPDVLLAAAGSEIYYGHQLLQDRTWASHIRFRWNRTELVDCLSSIDGVSFQDAIEQSEFKVSICIEKRNKLTKRKLAKELRSAGFRANIVFGSDTLIDVLPIRASTGLAIRYLLWKWALQPEKVLAVGTSGNEEAMISGNTLGAVIGAHSEELSALKGRPRIYFTKESHAQGVQEAIAFYNFLGTIKIPNENESMV